MSPGGIFKFIGVGRLTSGLIGGPTIPLAFLSAGPNTCFSEISVPFEALCEVCGATRAGILSVWALMVFGIYARLNTIYAIVINV